MLPTIRSKKRARTLLALCLGFLLVFNALIALPGLSSAAVAPLPGPGNPINYDDFASGGIFKKNWMNWFNQAGGTGTFTKSTIDSRTVGVFAQTPATSSSWAKFQPENELINLSGYRYVNVTMKNPGYADARIRIVVNDGTASYNLTAGWVAVPTSWTTSQYDLATIAPNLKKATARFEIWLRQQSGTYGEILIDGITATTASTGTAPTLTSIGVTANSTGTYNQNTSFNFAATYSDVDNEAPFAMQLVIDDTAYDMKEVDSSDKTYSNGKNYAYPTKLPVGTHTYYFRTTDATSTEVATSAQSLLIVNSEQLIDVVVSQAGYSANDFKNAKVTSTTAVTDTTYQILNGTTVVASGTMQDEGVIWNQHVYSIDFTAITTTGNNYTVKTNGISSYPFAIQPNIWNNYKDEMTAFYRIMRASVATSDAYPADYSTVAPSAKVFHPAGHLDDAASADRTQHYDLTGGWYDAGDYGKYGGNQWVGAEIALAYVRYADAASVKFDNDSNGIPDLIDEAIFGSEYVIKFADQLGGAMYNLKNNASFVHPEKATDNVSGTADDRVLSDYGIGGSAKSAGTLAATARAIQIAIAKGDITPSKAAALTSFAAKCQTAAEVFYNYVLAHPNDPVGSYTTKGGIDNSMLLADVELYLLTNNISYKNAAIAKINVLTLDDLASTNYWDMRPMSLAEFYPVAGTATQPLIQNLLKKQVDYFISTSDDTPYSVFNQFKNFGVNEPHASYLGDTLRYYELFHDPAALRAVQKGLYWIFGENPWNISWVSGIGTDYVDFLHTRFDEESNTPTGTGVIIPGAMVSGPNMKDTKDMKSVSPWYKDRSLYSDDTNQWRYNEFSISIQAGLLYTIMGLSATTSTTSPAGTNPIPLPILSPVIGDYVRGNVTVFAGPANGLSAITYKSGSSYLPMSVSGAVYATTIDESLSSAYANKRVDVRGIDAAGNESYSSTHYTIAAPLPDPSTPLLYDDFNGKGLWGSIGGNGEWVNWYNQNGGTGTFSRTTVDSKQVGKFTQTPTAVASTAKFQPWHDAVDVSGYRYLNFAMKNPGYSDMRMKIELNDGTRTQNLTGGWAAVPASWTDLQIDLNGLAYPVNKKAVTLSIWLKQNTVTYGELLIDEIKASNTNSGTAPTLTSAGVNAASGDLNTNYTFNVTYTDADNQAPFVMELVLDGVVHAMAPVHAADTTYTDGKAYTYTTKLPLGIHSYYFHTTDTSTDAISTTVQTGPIVSQTLFSDDFNDGNANGWTSTSGTWSVVSNQYSGQANSAQSLSLAGNADWTNYTFEAKVNVTNNTNGNKDAGLVFRYTDDNNYYVLFLKNNDKTGRKMELLKVVNGVRTVLGFTNPSIAADTMYTYKIVVNGSSISIYKDGNLEISTTDSALASGKIGARVYANTKAIFDDISVTR
ncbi:glycoside hydrolase family 9 protein [Paenibacillus sp. HWE-109]|uniref:glycoside hydrolase family 9 protein n=1 Tax=Paenibacillus sp. HWE-109 TaxID=1306526 RepID=UPI001EDD0246|nr:glycoside hydrolase family 9 protein [Paenibacillus sp. HWE-109]UKS27566.1 glycoside hydrolase family 9 protein [Paenibacillus sp. HWE-109]